MSREIDIQFTIDTDRVKQLRGHSQDKDNPISIGDKFVYPVAAGIPDISGQGTDKLDVKAKVGDVVRFFGTCGSDGYNNAVLLYDISKSSGDAVLGPFEPKTVNRAAMLPSSGNAVLPGSSSEQPFWFLQSKVESPGTEQYALRFALYTRDENGALQLYSYYQWERQITVHESEPFPAGTRWSVADFNDNGVVGAFSPTPWEFDQQGSMHAGDLWVGKYTWIQGCNIGISCEITLTGEPPQGDAFQVYFVTHARFVATKNGSLYRFGEKL